MVLAASAFAGCVSVPGGAVDPAPGLDTASIQVPVGAQLVSEEGKAVLRFVDVALPFEQEFQVPEGATIVRATAKVADTVPVGAMMLNKDTGRRRCNTDILDAWNLRVKGVSQCSGLAAIDPPGATWIARAASPIEGTVATVDVAFETTRLDGIAGALDLSKLSMPTYDLERVAWAI